MIATPAALIERGDLAAHDVFLLEVLDRYLPVANSLEAEHLLKACLLAPADAGLLARLEPTVVLAAAEIAPKSGARRYREWEAFSLALYYHRLGDPYETLRWVEECLRYRDSVGSRAAGARCLGAMACLRLGERERASEFLQHATRVIPAPPVETVDHPPLPGTWVSWSVARILLREAEEMWTGE